MSRRPKGQLPGRSESPSRSPAIVRHAGKAGGLKVLAGGGWLTIAVCGVLAAAVWTVFGQTLRHGFLNFDDDLNIYENWNVTRGLSRESISWAFKNFHGLAWNPLTFISHMMDCQIFGLKPSGHHF